MATLEIDADAMPHAIAVDAMAVEVKRDPVGTDHQPDGRAVDEIRCEPRVLGDGIATRDLLAVGGRDRRRSGHQHHRRADQEDDHPWCSHQLPPRHDGGLLRAQ